MSSPTLATFLLRARLRLARANPLTGGAMVLLLAAAGGLAWSAHAVHALQVARHVRAATSTRLASTRATPIAPAAQNTPPDNLAAFYGTLGERNAAAQQLKILFALAARSGLTLVQGEYKSGYERNARVHTYQVNLPVKGSYAAIWHFAFGALRAIPFAALDDIGFRRDSIGDAQVEARLRLTLYLSDRPAAVMGATP
jgi:hypothetical protein